MAPTHSKVCTDQLMKELEKPITTNSKAWRILEKLSTCFVAVAKDVVNISIELYGNGTPGGLKVEVMNIARDIREIRQYIEEQKQAPHTRRSEDVSLEATPDDFQVFVKWIVDKIIPPLLVGAIVTITNVLIFVVALITAITYGWVTL